VTRAVQRQERAAGDGERTVASIQGGQSLYPAPQFLWVWDGARYPRGSERQAVLARENAAWPAEDGNVPCLWFAPNAPEPNPTADFGLKGKPQLRKQLAANKTFAAVKQCFSAFLRTLSFESVKWNWYWPYPQMI
jgi:hypothetical protein